MTVQVRPNSLCVPPSVAPRPIRRVTSAARSALLKSTCMRFLPCLLSGTFKNSRRTPAWFVASMAKYGSARSMAWPVASAQKAASFGGSAASKVTFDRVSTVSLLRGSGLDADELDLGHLLDGVLHALAAEA